MRFDPPSRPAHPLFKGAAVHGPGLITRMLLEDRQKCAQQFRLSVKPGMLEQPTPLTAALLFLPLASHVHH